MKERLQKIMAHAGVGSRRSCEELITAGRVTVDGEVVTTLGTSCDPAGSVIKVDGEPLRTSRGVYLALNKPRGVVSTSADELMRPTVLDLVSRVGQRVFAVGRLDRLTEGLLLLTNDGDFAQLVSHPRFQIPKTYVVRVRGRFKTSDREAVARGVWISDGKCSGMEVTRILHGKSDSTLTIQLSEGKNRELRRVLARLGYPVLALKRVSIGPIQLGELRSGQYRSLRRDEIEELRSLASGGPPQPEKARTTPEGRSRPGRRKAGWAVPRRRGRQRG